MDDDSPGASSSAQPVRASLGPIKRIIIALAVLFTAFHVFASFLWIAPSSQLRDVVPGNMLPGYMIPMFGQSWSVFAPNPINGDYRLQVRAVAGDDGQDLTTDWVNATDAEMALHMRHLFPPRGAMSATDISSRFKNAFDKLNSSQQEVAGLGYYKGEDWSQRLEDALIKNAGKDQNQQVVTRFIEIDRITTAYASQVAYAMWGADIKQVQFVVSRQNVVPFAERNNPQAERPAPQVVPTGWRGVIEEPGQSREKFAATFLRGVEASKQSGLR